MAGKHKTIIKWQDHPAFNPRNTNQLRKLIERRQAGYLWGQKEMIVPRLAAEVFGDGRQLLQLYPMMFRPKYFVVRIDSKMDTSSKEFYDLLDTIYTSIEEEFVEWPWAKEYGMKWDGDDDFDESKDQSSRLSFCDGSVWGTMKWPRVHIPKRRSA